MTNHYSSFDPTVQVHRDGAYYYAAVPVDNSQGPVAAEVTVAVRGPGGETVRTESFTRLVPAARDRCKLWLFRF